MYGFGYRSSIEGIEGEKEKKLVARWELLF
jgi:hypothetical protein